MTLALSRASAGLSVFTLALGFALSGLWVGMVAVLAVGALWLLDHLRAPSHQRPPVAALVAWDLDQFAQRMRAAGRVDDAPGLERRHIRRLLVVAAIGGVLGAIALGLRVRLSFGLALLLAALAMLGLGIAIGFMRRLRD